MYAARYKTLERGSDLGGGSWASENKAVITGMYGRKHKLKRQHLCGRWAIRLHMLKLTTRQCRLFGGACIISLICETTTS